MSDQLSDRVETLARDRGLNISPEVIAEAVRRVQAAMAQTGAPAASGNGGGAGHLDATRDFPLATRRPDLVESATGKHLDDITVDKVTSGQITFDDIKVRPETLEYQAQIAESAGRPHLAANLRRAAEMTRIPDERVLEIYNALRPHRSTKQQLLDIAEELDSKYQAKQCAAHVREAAEVYERRGRLAGDR